MISVKQHDDDPIDMNNTVMNGVVLDQNVDTRAGTGLKGVY